MTRPSLIRLCLHCTWLLWAMAASAGELQDAGKFFKARQYDAAMQQVDAWLVKNPKDAQGRFLKGVILTEENKPEDAIGVFRSLTEDYPEMPEPHNNLAVIYASRGQYDKARSELESAIEAYPAYATAHENLGDVYIRMAEQSYGKALEFDGSSAGVKEKLDLAGRILSLKRRN